MRAVVWIAVLVGGLAFWFFGAIGLDHLAQWLVSVR